MFIKQLGRLLILTSIPLHSFAAESYNLDQLVDVALNQNLSLKIEQEAITQTELAKIDSDRLRWPSLSMNGSTTNDLENQSGSLSINLNQPIYQGGSISVKQKQANLELRKTNINLNRKRQSLKKDVQLAYIDILESLALEKEEKLSLTQLKEQARIANVMYSEGDVWKNDVLQANVSIAQGEAKVIAANNSVLLKKSALNILLNFDLSNEINIEGKLEWREYHWTWDKIKAHINSSHPELNIAKINENIADLSIKNQRSSKRPTLNMSSSVVHNEYFTSNIASSNDMTISLSASWQLWDAGNINRNISNARVEKKKKSIELFNTRQIVLQQAQQSWLKFKEAENQVSVLKQAIDIALENYRVNTVRYQEKLGTANDLLTAQTLLSKSKKDWISALARYLKSVYTLQYNLG